MKNYIYLFSITFVILFSITGVTIYATEDTAIITIHYADGSVEEREVDENLETFSYNGRDVVSIEIPDLPNLNAIILIGSQIEQTDDIIGLENLNDTLTALVVFDNQLSNFNISHLPNLELLVLSDNQLDESTDLIGFENHQNLTKLTLGNNLFTSLQLSDIPNLRTLDLSGEDGQIESLELTNLPSLETLFVNGNPLPREELYRIRDQFSDCYIEVLDRAWQQENDASQVQTINIDPDLRSQSDMLEEQHSRQQTSSNNQPYVIHYDYDSSHKYNIIYDNGEISTTRRNGQLLTGGDSTWVINTYLSTTDYDSIEEAFRDLME